MIARNRGIELSRLLHQESCSDVSKVSALLVSWVHLERFVPVRQSLARILDGVENTISFLCVQSTKRGNKRKYQTLHLLPNYFHDSSSHINDAYTERFYGPTYLLLHRSYKHFYECGYTMLVNHHSKNNFKHMMNKKISRENEHIFYSRGYGKIY